MSADTPNVPAPSGRKAVAAPRGLAQLLADIDADCLRCGVCLKDCAFLRAYGMPGEIAAGRVKDGVADPDMPFSCSLCGLCGAVCPAGINAGELFLAMRRENVLWQAADFSRHKPILGYEAWGKTRFASLRRLPEGCDTVFFPGCALPGTRPEKTYRLFAHMRGLIPNLGLVLDCCAKPSHDLGRAEAFAEHFFALRDDLAARGVRRVYVACPNCFRIFETYGGPLQVATVYEFLAEHGLPASMRLSGVVSVHDPCGLRDRPEIQDAVRAVVTELGLTLREMPHARGKALCCGEGGSAPFIAPALAGAWTAKRAAEAASATLVTYCAGCADRLGRATPTCHLLDLLFEPEAALRGKAKAARSPFTYWNRMRLKRRMRKLFSAARERGGGRSR